MSMSTDPDDIRGTLSPAASLMTAFALLALGQPLGAQADAAPPTFASEVAPIFYESCVECHRPGGIAPMSLISYETARQFAPLIKLRVENRVMPPWHLDRTVGIQDYKNDLSLSEAEIETIVRWVDAGAPEGDASALPSAPEFPSGDEWRVAVDEDMGPPDRIVRSTPYDVMANGQDQWWGPEVDFEGLDEERWIRAYEFKPSHPDGFKVVHHGHATFIQERTDTRVGIAHYGVGKSYEVFPEDVGMPLPAGEAKIHWNLHYAPFATDEPVADDVVEVGLWFYPEGEKPAIQTGGERLLRVDRMNGMSRGADILIPPHSYQVLQGVHVLDTPAELYSFRPHMHTRGKEMSMEAIYPDGRREVLSKVDNYRHNWQIAYQYADHAKPLLPKGTVLLFTSVFDNTEANPINPDPTQWVTFGRRGVDEMSHAWVGITHLTEEQYERMKAEREGRLARTEQDDEG